jgi:hypothetical protein
MGAGVTKVNKVTLSAQVKSEKLVEKDGAIYCNLEREEYKLNSDILKSMEKMNNFSKDEEAETEHNKKK